MENNYTDGKEVGTCEQCGNPVYEHETCTWEDDTGYWIEGEEIWLHEDCLKPYAKAHWKHS